jgi:hypothetical protein
MEMPIRLNVPQRKPPGKWFSALRLGENGPSSVFNGP